MGVMNCDRRDCTKVMCDRQSYEFGRICNECFNELETTRPVDIKAFMESPKQTGNNPFTKDFDYGEVFVDTNTSWGSE